MKIFFTVSMIGIMLVVLCTNFGGYAQAQYYVSKQSNEPSVIHAKQVAGACLGQWEAQGCLSAVSESTLVLAANYAGVLEAQGKKSAVEQIKQHCAAGTAAMRENIPAYAMKSAWAECANMIYDVSETTGTVPDQSHYQLLAGPILCLEKDRRCADVEQGLKRYK